jgi:hypothetical protein
MMSRASGPTPASRRRARPNTPVKKLASARSRTLGRSPHDSAGRAVPNDAGRTTEMTREPIQVPAKLNKIARAVRWDGRVTSGTKACVAVPAPRKTIQRNGIVAAASRRRATGLAVSQRPLALVANAPAATCASHANTTSRAPQAVARKGAIGSAPFPVSHCQ